MLLFGVAGNQDVIEVDETEGDTMEDAVHQPLECVAKGMRRNSQSPKGVMTAVLGTSAAATGI